MKRLAILLIIGSLAGCDDPPEKPAIEICAINHPDQECICAIKEPGKPIGDIRDEPLEYCDKATAFRPAEWEKVQNYIDEMEAWIKRNRR